MTTDNRIANGISKIAEFKDTVFFRADCSCMTPEHEQTLVIEYDEESDSVMLNIYVTVASQYYPWSHADNRWERVIEWFDEKWKRICMMTNILFKGYIKAEHGMIFRNEDCIEDYIFALREGLNKSKAAQLAWKEKQKAREADYRKEQAEALAMIKSEEITSIEIERGNKNSSAVVTTSKGGKITV